MSRLTKALEAKLTFAIENEDFKDLAVSYQERLAQHEGYIQLSNSFYVNISDEGIFWAKDGENISKMTSGMASMLEKFLDERYQDQLTDEQLEDIAYWNFIDFQDDSRRNF